MVRRLLRLVDVDHDGDSLLGSLYPQELVWIRASIRFGESRSA